MSAADRTCKACKSESLLSVKEARMVYPSLSRFGADAMLEDAQLLCTHCCVAQMNDGEWERIMSADQRAYNLSRTGNKSKAEYQEKLTRGTLPTGGSEDDTDDSKVEDTGKSW